MKEASSKVELQNQHTAQGSLWVDQHWVDVGSTQRSVQKPSWHFRSSVITLGIFGSNHPVKSPEFIFQLLSSGGQRYFRVS